MRVKGMGAVVIVTEVAPIKAIEATMDGFSVMPMDEAAKYGSLFVTLTGCTDVIVKRHFENTKDSVLLASSGHFNVEINKNDLTSLATEIWERKPNIRGYRMADGRAINLLPDGRLVNPAAGNGNPAEITDISLCIQAKGLGYLAKNSKNMDKKVYAVPAEIDREVALIKLDSTGIKIDVLPPKKQEEHLARVEQ